MEYSALNNGVKIAVDAAMTLGMLLLMAYSLVGEAAHEWIGMGMHWPLDPSELPGAAKNKTQRNKFLIAESPRKAVHALRGLGFY